MLVNDKIMFDRYYCKNSTKTQQKLRKCLRTLFFSLNHSVCLLTHVFINMLDSGRGQVLIITRVDLKASHVLNVASWNRCK